MQATGLDITKGRSMRRLSQKAWNNVLIFSMLILIVIFNYDRLFPNATNNALNIVDEGEFILSMQINQLNFERIGTGWRVSAPRAEDIPNMQSEDIDELVTQWQRALLRPTANTLSPQVTESPEYLISIWLAGQRTAKVIGLLSFEDTPYVVYEGELYLLDFPNLNQLLPDSI